MKGTSFSRTTSDMIELLSRAGFGFEISALFTLSAGSDKLEAINKANNGYVFFSFKTGSKPAILYGRKISYDDEGVHAYVYRDPVYTGGTILDKIRNSNDVNPEEPEVVIKTGILGANISSIGEESRAPAFVFGNNSNQGNGGFVETIDTPQLILPNKEFLLIFKNRSTSNVQHIGSTLRWVEGDIPDLIVQNGSFVAYNGPLKVL